VCRQWNSIIAVNYKAREYGISRHDNIEDAKKKCSTLHAPHVATFKKGSKYWDYYESPDVANYKVSLDPFRKFSRQIFQILKEYTTDLEKGSIDEVFIDLGPYLYSKTKELFPQLHADEIDLETNLPEVPSALPESLVWKGILFNDQENPLSSIDDWDDVFLRLASMYVAEMREHVYRELGFTCSAGLARNKTLAKLGSGTNKPNNQTIIRNRDVNEFLLGFEITDLWGLGGKYGKKILQAFNSPESGTMELLQRVPLTEMQSKLGNGEGLMLYNIVHGLHVSEIRLRIDITSMQSVKQFTAKSLITEEDCKLWLKVFAADLAGRVFQLDEEADTPRRPKRVVLSHGNIKNSGPKQVQEQTSTLFSKTISIEKFTDELYIAGCDLLSQLLSNPAVTFFPCTMLSLGLGNFELIGAGKSIESFFISPKKPSAQSIPSSSNSFSHSSLMAGISENQSTSKPPSIGKPKIPPPQEPSYPSPVQSKNSVTNTPPSSTNDEDIVNWNDNDNPLFVTNTTFCDKCKESIESFMFNEHLDWHVAKDLQEKENKRSQTILSQAKRPYSSQSAKNVQPSSTPSKKKKKDSKDQSIFKFFK
jgi:DNA polymerase eta